jgi:septal ring factor EnvC (AmiA/AmiB activator)
MNEVLTKIGELLATVPQFQTQAEQVKALLSKNIPKQKDFDAQLQTLQARVGSTKKKLEQVRGEKDRLQTLISECLSSEQKLDQELKALSKDRDNLIAHAPNSGTTDVRDDEDEAGGDEEMPETLPPPSGRSTPVRGHRFRSDPYSTRPERKAPPATGSLLDLVGGGSDVASAHGDV